MKKFLSLLLALTMVTSLVACGGNNKPADNGASSNTTQNETPSTPSTPRPPPPPPPPPLPDHF